MAQDLTNVYKIDEAKGLVKYTVKCHGRYFTGKSKVNVADGDVFDLEKGKRIAKLRAVLKMKRAQLTELIEFRDWVREVASTEEKLTEQIQVFTNSTIHLQDKLSEALGIPAEESKE